LVNIEQLIADFCLVATKAGVSIPKNMIESEVLERPHVPPNSLPSGKMAVYVFYWEDRCLKVGKVGPKSSARYTSQHYNPWSSNSNLAASILKNRDDLGLPNMTDENIGAWIKQQTTRLNFLLPAELGMPVLSLLEAFLQCRLRPEFEGFESQKG
jgi:hypothetical protein